MSSTPPVIVWFRQDLRRTDNPALSAAADAGYPVLPRRTIEKDAWGTRHRRGFP